MAEAKALEDERPCGLKLRDLAIFLAVVLLVVELRLDLRFPFLERLMLRASWLRYLIQSPEFKRVLVKHIIQKQEKYSDLFKPKEKQGNANAHILISWRRSPNPSPALHLAASIQGTHFSTHRQHRRQGTNLRMDK